MTTLEGRLVRAIHFGLDDVFNILIQNPNIELNEHEEYFSNDGTVNRSPLFWAVKKNRIHMIRPLMEAGARYNTPTKSPLIYACENGQIEIVKEFLSIGVELNQVFQNSTTPLMEAVYNGYIDIVDLLISAGARMDYNPSSDELTVLSAAIDANNITMVKHLLSVGAKLNVNLLKDETILATTIYLDGSPEIIDILLKAGADPNVGSYRGNSSLTGAVRTSNTKIIKLLLSAGANTNLPDSSGKVPLYYASSIEIAELLLSAGADPRLANDILFRLISSNKFEMFEFFLSPSLGLDANVKSSSDVSILSYAISRDRYEIFKLLLISGARTDSGFVNQTGRNILQVAQRNFDDSIGRHREGVARKILELIEEYTPSLAITCMTSIRSHRVDVSSLPSGLFPNEI